MAYTDYDTIGTGYDGTRQADAYLVGRLLTLLDRPPGSRILDVGCGTGNYTSALQVDEGDLTNLPTGVIRYFAGSAARST